MKPIKLTAVLGLLVALGACAPVGRIILLPEEGGKASAVEIRTKAGSSLLTKPYQTTTVAQDGALQNAETDAATVAQQYKLLLAQKPAPELRFTLRFAEGSRLRPESEALLAEILAQASQRTGAEIFVTGHTDSVGSLEANDTLSLQRARLIRDALISKGFKPELIESIGRGERELLVPTADEIDEPRNRRAEIVIR